MKIIRLENIITIVLNDGSIISSDKCTDEMFNDIYNHQDNEDYVKNILIPEFYKKKEQIKQKINLLKDVSKSKYLVSKGMSIYIPTISELSLPEDLIDCFIKAEKDNNEELIQTYLNFWTLVSLNPDSRCRQNLFWFLNKYGMKISKSGLFVGYKNVLIKKQGSNIDAELAKIISSEYFRIKCINKKSPKNYILCKENKKYKVKRNTSITSKDVTIGKLCDLYTMLSDVDKSTIYTDWYTETFTIKIGEVVSMPREKCDNIQEHPCSCGLHIASKDWLEKNCFGEVGMLVLVNPADVVAVPPVDNYGKLRTCAYYPVTVVDFGEDKHIIEPDIKDGFEDDFLRKICYNGTMSNNDLYPYTLTIPNVPEIDRSIINEKLLEIAKNTIKKVET